MIIRLLLVLLLGIALQPSFGQQPYWQQQVNFDMDVSLNDAEHTLDGFAKITYINRSPDTLRFIWFHLWPNAFKNDRTAFSDQLLQNGRTDFYFSDAEQRGYINRLDFKVNNITATVKDHPQHQDIVQVLLPQALPPGATAHIATPFHVKLPQNFSRGGHIGQSYQITQWFPKPAVYDRNGWHPMPYLDQGEFYSNFGNYRVQITLPANYIVAATGKLVNPPDVLPVLVTPASSADRPGKAATTADKKKKAAGFAIKKKADALPPSDSRSITYLFEQDNVHDFAWFADKRYQVQTDTVQLPSGRTVRMTVYHLPDAKGIWKNSLSMIRKTLLSRSQWLGEYPYNTVSVAEAPMGFSGGMEYPTITSLSPVDGELALEELIEHEVGHNWNQGILATNERQHPWMDEGFNSYYDRRYNKLYPAHPPKTKGFGAKQQPADMDALVLRTIYAERADQPIATEAEAFTELNSNFIAYTKTALWLEKLEALLGTALFDRCMQTFYQRWQFKHPQPADFKAVAEEVSGRNLDDHFALLYRKGPLDSAHRKKDLRLTALTSLRETDRHQYIGIAPVLGFNTYDKLMLGAVIHNYTLPLPRFRFAVAPLYATGSKGLAGLGRLSYTHRWGNKGQLAELGLSGMRFTGDDFVDSTGTKNFLRFSRVVPSLKIDFGRSHPRSTVRKYLLLRSFLIGETQLRFGRDPVTLQETIRYPVVNRYVNQLRLVIENDRALYPWRGDWQVEQGQDFVRAAFTGNYHFNYNAKGGGLDLRVFAGKFFYLGDRTFAKQFATDIYHLNLTGPKGNEDYTYSNYFVGRNEFEGFASQQIMMRDGGFKVRTDLLSSKIGKTDNWLAAVNLVSTIPAGLNPLEILPIKIPLRVFVDIGTFAEAWQKGATTGRFVYDAGLQVSLFRNTLHVYFPLLYSKVYKDYFRSTLPDKRFARNIAFSIDIQHLRLKKFIGPSWL
jgi:hypothetical protein